MTTATLHPVIHIYKEINVGKYKSVKHYELIESNYKPILSNQINISKDRNCAQSMPDYWLKLKDGNKWTKCITGLFKTSKSNIFKGDANRKKHLILFKFSDNANTLTIFYFEDYYTNDISNVLSFLR